MKKYNITVPRKYEKNGEEKTAWGNVGRLVKFDATESKPESFIIELNMFPETKFMVFEEKEKEDAPKKQVVEEPTIQTEETQEEVW